MVTPAGSPVWPTSGGTLRHSLRNSFGKSGFAWMRAASPVHVVGNDLMQTPEHNVIYTSTSSLKGRANPGHTHEHKVWLADVFEALPGRQRLSFPQPDYDESDATLGGLAFEGPYGREHLPVMTYRWSNGMPEEFPASWALPESDIMRALEYFVQHEGRRAPFVQWHDDAVAEPSSE